MINKEQIRQYFRAFLLALVILAVFSLYLFLRRGYFNLLILNKSIASTSLVLLGAILLIGPFSRFYNRFDKWLIYRREIGIAAFLLALAHSIISYSGRTSPALLWGMISLAILALLFFTSHKFVESRMSRRFWVEFQSWGIRLGALFAFWHLTILKYSSWLKWISLERDQKLVLPDLPPASLIGALFIGFVAITRFAEILGVKTARKIFEISFIVLIFAIIALFFLDL
ncbi:MAG: hypothetical protein A3F95_01525 [Candidatus Nealsonbacteria bacterium RIFCSPLOWO2_12_FULL_39_31]|uniref:Ferric oxidoreductase domain-containing protein n=2 Tax=Candidatus Nealsoniibacteriota TaxID=1817911 RepID=A0A1G2EMR3_9BACT|nr:MAG: hypothetical protein US88_C0015G0012 [Parcubacteria group bacterium GW2011_GWA2_38_27]KKQ97949.1 MAG: hypothetical protein UT22_C0006G0030 [Parcubacteria group bacterium GW2011_GWC2_39_11]OGZ19593.1 MAG: hypothetical protein A2626_00590 [Candidatus Nealsonbacteria bacterium RIFCSPHIGHO2_01_FULL_38_55]OGZ21576.1 MAG: hypothetical protein A2W55_01065 [Candidatus Nealsonbacteria bacterium RIFCSPHIGHO2_02_38_10]OGZ23275.1 MAG: hypothetical protein A3E18_00960 [Candidatus Nealsonbacteria bac